MDKKKILIIVFLIILIVVFIFFVRSKKYKTNNELKAKNDDNISENEIIKYDEETALYYIENEKTGDIVFADPNKENLQIYIDNPDYNPSFKEQEPKTLEEYWMDLQMIEEQSIEDT